MSDCGSCAALQSQVAQLRAENGSLRSGIASTIAFIEQQTDKPTIPRQRLIPTILGRLHAVLGR